MRILLLTDWNREHGGSERYVAELRDALARDGDDVRLLTSSAGDAGHGTADYVAYGSNSRLVQAGLQLHNPFATATIRRAVKEFRPDVALVFMFALQLSPGALRALGEVPKLIAISDYKPICPVSTRLLPDRSLCNEDEGLACLRNGCVGPAHWLRDQPRYRLIRRALRNADQIITCSEWMKDELAVRGVHADCVPLASHPPPPSFTREPSAEPTFLYRGRLDAEKGVDIVLQALASLRRECPATRLDILGRGPMQSDLEALTAALGLSDSVVFHGWKQGDEMWPFLSRAWAQVVPSLWAEPLGLVAVESVLCGVPTIVSRKGGLAEIVGHCRGGLQVDNGDVEGWKNAMATIAVKDHFSDQRVADEDVAATQRKYDWQQHVREIRQRCRAVASDRNNR